MNLLEFLYFGGLSAKMRFSLRRRRTLPRPVLSIGNLTVGGTGKTPAAIALAGEALARGLKPCILTRGYKGKAGDLCLVSKGEGPLMNSRLAGDEAVLMARKLTGVPVVKGKNRYEAGMFALSVLPHAIGPALFILDDGFQHWKLSRDKDVLLIDGSNPFGNGRMLPLGPLREPVEAIGRADIIVITRRDQSRMGGLGEHNAYQGLITKIRKLNSSSPLFSAWHRPSAFLTAAGAAFPIEWAKGRRFFGFSGIGSNDSFRETLRSLGLELAGFRPFRDHHRFSQGDLESIRVEAGNCKADWIVTTEKDIMRLEDFKLPGNLVALAVEFCADEGFYGEVFRGIENPIR